MYVLRCGMYSHSSACDRNISKAVGLTLSKPARVKAAAMLLSNCPSAYSGSCGAGSTASGICWTCCRRRRTICWFPVDEVELCESMFGLVVAVPGESPCAE
jgi:hypothetical protein